MPKLIVRRTGNSLSLALPRAVVRQFDLSPGDELVVEMQRVPRLSSLSGVLKGKITADEFTALSNEGEDLG